MKVILQASSISGEINVPASKSVMQRACASALLHKGTSDIYNFGSSSDDLAALSIIQQLGARVEHFTDKISIQSEGIPTIQSARLSEIHCKESGLSARMFTSIAAISSHTIWIHGEGSLLKRPMNFFEDVFPLLGVDYESTHGCLPARFQGPLRPISLTVDGSISSQYITGLLMAYSVLVEDEITLRIKNAVSRPYIDLSIDVMHAFLMNVPIKVNEDEYLFRPSSIPSESKITYTVEGDWSNASFWLVAAAIFGSISIRGLQFDSKQADKAILNVLRSAGAEFYIEDDVIYFHHRQLHSFDFDACDCPDLFPPLAVLASFCKGTSRIRGVHRLIHKESNRCESIIQEFSKLGIVVYNKEDSLYLEGATKINGGIVSSHNDHRMAMALAIIGLACEETLEIREAESVKKSYPEFWSILQQVGASIEVIEN